MSQYSFEQFAAVRNYSDLSFSPDGQWVTYLTNVSGQMNVWKQPVHQDEHGRSAMPIQLTSIVERSARRAVWSPSGGRIITMADFHGTENYQIYEIPPDTGWLYPITDNPEIKYELGDNPFSPDGRFLAYDSNERDPHDMDLIIHDLVTGETKVLLADGNYYAPGDWSPNGKYLLGIQFNANTDMDIYLIEVATGKSRLLTAHEGEVKFLPGAWKADSSGFYMISDDGREFSGLAFYDLASDTYEWLQTPDWDIQDMSASKDGRFLAWLVNEDGYNKLYIQDNESGDVNQFSQLPPGVYSDLVFSPTEPILGLYITRTVRPGDLYMINLETDDIWTLTQGFLGGIPVEEMVEPELIRYETHDGRSIPAFLYKPRGLKKGERTPVILSIHGGPEAQERPTYNYNGFYQYLLHRGIGILGTNVRGSTGYGKTYQKLIHRDWGGAELKDFDYAVRYLHALDWVAPDRIGVFGGSFGGFATLSCVTRLPQYWAAAVDIVGPSNLVTFTKSVPPSWKRFLTRWVGDPEDDYDFLMERSPISYVNNVESPLLVIQGANDPRVVKEESDQIVAQLQKLGREIDYMVFEDEGHGFTKTANWLKALRASANWFEKHLNVV